MLLFQYPKCTTCKKAVKWLEDNGIEYISRNIKEENPTYDELKKIYTASGLPIKKLFNTSGMVYRSMGLKDKLDTMSDDDILQLLASDGMLVKRPVLITDNSVLIGFKEAVWEDALLDN
ncbi:MAG: arsenate reductase family protein [Acutalibacteraceae bacterium]|nr:arsenate reductase family protein [Acutalibacteraceae bacterium]